MARYNELDVDDAAFIGGYADPTVSATRARGWAVGLNWYLNRNVKQVVDFERTTFSGGAGDGRNRPAENAFFIRTQVSF